MKKLISFCLCLIAGVAMAQVNSETLTLTAVKKGEEPKEVMAAIKQDFPKAIVGDLSMLPSEMYGKHWSVDLQDNLDGVKPDFYQVTLNETNEHYKAVYDKSGKLLSSKTVVKHAQLPTDVSAAITQKYSGWTVIKDSEKITYREGKLKEAYRVEIQKDKVKRGLFIDTGGKIVKDILVNSGPAK